MGYTHHWRRPIEIPPDQMRAIADDFGRLVLPLVDVGVGLGGWDGEGVPQVTPVSVCLKGHFSSSTTPNKPL